MPIKTAKQFKLMQLAANNPKKLKGIGPSRAVALEMICKTSKSQKAKFARTK